MSNKFKRRYIIYMLFLVLLTFLYCYDKVHSVRPGHQRIETFFEENRMAFLSDCINRGGNNAAAIEKCGKNIYDTWGNRYEILRFPKYNTIIIISGGRDGIILKTEYIKYFSESNGRSFSIYKSDDFVKVMNTEMFCALPGFTVCYDFDEYGEERLVPFILSMAFDINTLLRNDGSISKAFYGKPSFFKYIIIQLLW